MYFYTAATLQQVLRFLEFLIVRTNDNRYAVDCCLRNVVDAYSKTSSHVCHRGVAVDTCQQAVAINDEAVSIFHALRICLRIAGIRTFELADDILNMCLADHMRSQNEFQIGVLVEVLDKEILIGFPTATSYEYWIFRCIGQL